jgi:hypothetical protein
MKNLTELQSQVHRKLLDIRRIDRMVSSMEFEVAYDACSKREELYKIIDNIDADALQRWLRQEVEANIGEYSIRQLRVIAAQHGIPKYSLKTKSELLMAIVECYRDKGTNDSGNHHQTNGNGHVVAQVVSPAVAQSHG